MDGITDLSYKNGITHYGVDGWEATHNRSVAGSSSPGAGRKMVAVFSVDGVRPGGRLSHTALAAGHLLSDGGHRAARRGG